MRKPAGAGNLRRLIFSPDSVGKKCSKEIADGADSVDKTVYLLVPHCGWMAHIKREKL